jgi:hypothetical protein
VLVGPVTLVHLWPFVSDALDGSTYRDVFHQPYASWYPDLPTPAYVAVLCGGVVAACAMTVGLFTRAATVATFAVVAYNLALSTTHFHNNRAYLVIVLGILAITPTGGELSFDAWWSSRRVGRRPVETASAAWPLLLLRFECSVVYGASGVSKLVDPDWFGGTVTWGRIVNGESQLRASPLPEWFVDGLLERSLHTGVAKVIVLTEIFIAVALWVPRLRLMAVWVAIVFHAMIEVSASVQVFSYLAVTVLLVWATPSTRDRAIRIDPTSSVHLRAVRIVRVFDWLARFRVEHGRPGDLLVVIDRDGRVRSGGPAAVLIASRLPLCAWFALPLTLLPVARTGARNSLTSPP